MISDKDYIKIVTQFYIDNQKQILNIAKKVKRNFYSIPLEVEDITLHSIYQFFTAKTKNDFLNSRIVPYEKFFFARIEYFMLTKCNEYIKNQHKILNNYLEVNSFEFSCSPDYYFFNDPLNFLSIDEFNIIYKIKVLKLKRKVIAHELKINLSKLRDLERKIINKIIKNKKL